MKEDFLQLLWQHQLLDRRLPWLVDLQLIQVVKTGFRNLGAGPDFAQAKLWIGNLEWNGSVEIHVRASEWNAHGHQLDAAYDSVILHVVWENDVDVFRSDGTLVPTFEINDRVPLEVLLRYRSMMDHQKPQKPCAPFLPQMESITLISMQEKVLIERLERKSEMVQQRFVDNQQDWQETWYQTLAWTLGLKANSDPMLELAQTVSSKHLAAQGWKMEAVLPMLLGVAGFLDGSGPVTVAQRKQYDFYAQKYRLRRMAIPWQTAGLRSSSFPLIRIILLARMLSQLKVWMQQITEMEHPSAFFERLKWEPLPDWIGPFLLENNLGVSGTELSPFIQNSLVINVFVPILTAMSLHTGETKWMEKAIDWLTLRKPEMNRIVDGWKNLDIHAQTAAESQSLIELHNLYCLKKRCMNCTVGLEILSA